MAVVGSLALCVASPATAQQADGSTEHVTLDAATPDTAARLFLRSVRSIRWDATGYLLHPTTVQRFATLVELMIGPDTTGRVAEYFIGREPAHLAAMSPVAIFETAVERTIADMPGLMHALFDRDDEIVGHVTEGADSAHVVYRTEARISGASPEVKVMQVVRSEDGWRVLWSDELEVLEAALRGAARATR